MCNIDSQLPSGRERRGVSHHVDAWYEQGHKVRLYLISLGEILIAASQKKGLIPSSSLAGKGSRQTLAARKYKQATRLQAAYLDQILKQVAPREYGRLSRAQKAGRWLSDDTNNCFLGVATIWKLQVEAHVDHRDCLLSVITCGGSFSKGYMYLPDLGLCLRWFFQFYSLYPS
jgi:hypothetical protein